MTIAVDLGRKATKQTNRNVGSRYVLEFYQAKTDHFGLSITLLFLTLYLIETPLNTFAYRVDPDQAALVR